MNRSEELAEYIKFTRGELEELVATARAGNFNNWEFYKNENGEYVIPDGEEKLKRWNSGINKIYEVLDLK